MKSLKRIKNIILSLVLLITALSSCDDMDFLERKDDTLALIQDSVRTERDLQLLMLGAYNGMRANGFLNGSATIAADMLADDAYYTGANFEWSQVQTQKMDMFNGLGRDMWEKTYQTINYANQAAYSSLSEEILGENGGSVLKADASFIRSVGHFHLVRHFGLPYAEETKNIAGRGVPVRIKGNVNNTDVSGEIIQRATVDSVYRQIIRDLNYAINNLPANRTWLDGQATRDAAKAMLAKVHFYQNDMSAVVATAHDIVKDNGTYSLDADPTSKFARASSKQTTREVIFMIPSTAEADDSWDGIRDRYNPNATAIQYFPTTELVEAYDPVNDKRLATFYKYTAPTWYNTKFNYINMDAIVIGYNELMLYYAEALAETGDLTAAVKWLNQIELRAYGTAKTNASAGKTTVVEAIQSERRLEMAGQGERLHELKRLKKEIRGAAWNSSQTLFQIPDTEQNGNPEVILN